MFGKKEDNLNSAPPDVNVVTIPADFYAGANPEIKFKEVEKVVDLGKFDSGVKAHEKKALDKATVAGGELAAHPSNLLANRKFLVIAGIILFVIFLIGAGAYYWLQARKSAAGAVPVTPSATAPVAPIQETPPAAVPTTSPEISAPTTSEGVPVAGETAMEFPSRLLGASVDSDSDGLTDMAEEIFGTDPLNPDTDGDNYPDGHELFYLYNPNGFEPKKIIDSGTVKEYENPFFGYSVYYPVNWAVGKVDDRGRQTLFSTLTGENIEIRVFDIEPGTKLADWLALNAPGERLEDLQDFSSRFDAVGKMRNDGLVYYFISGGRLYVLVYHTTDSNTVNYKIVLEVMARSFRLNQAGEAEAVPTSTPVTAPVESAPTGTMATSAPETGELFGTTTPEAGLL